MMRVFLFVFFLQEGILKESLAPVDGVNDDGFEIMRFRPQGFDGVQHVFIAPAVQPGNVDVGRSLFRVQQNRSGQPGRQRGFSHAFRPVDDDSLRTLLHSALDVL